MIAALEAILIALTTLLFLRLAGAPWVISAAALRRIALEPAFRRPFLIAGAVLALSMVETRFDDRITAALGWDATGWIHALEGDLAAVFQRWASPPATYLFAYIYIVIIVVVMAAPLLHAAAAGDATGFRALTRGLQINYLAAIPFYLFFPVKEMWAGNPSRVRLLVDEVHPAIMEAYRTTSALDNCFPSLHCSLALTAAIIAGRVSPRPLAAAVWMGALAVVLSTVYLGIHWLTDLAAGAALATLAGSLALRGAGLGGKG